MGRYLLWLSPLVVLEFAPAQMQNPKKLIECFKKVCPDPGNALVLLITALCRPVPIKCYPILFSTFKRKKMPLDLIQPSFQALLLLQLLQQALQLGQRTNTYWYQLPLYAR